MDKNRTNTHVRENDKYACAVVGGVIYTISDVHGNTGIDQNRQKWTGRTYRNTGMDQSGQ